jgi:hypothetical protein
VKTTLGDQVNAEDWEAVSISQGKLRSAITTRSWKRQGRVSLKAPKEALSATF